ncbi:MAG: hypothetical protein GX330_04015 [Bacteroidales bacterium]|nr:hypothetical protein [Bacteroidales bacterium]
MKKVSLILFVLAVTAICITSCGKNCICGYYEDGKLLYTRTDKDIKIYNQELCEDMSEGPYPGYSIITEGKKVTIEVKCR